METDSSASVLDLAEGEEGATMRWKRSFAHDYSEVAEIGRLVVNH